MSNRSLISLFVLALVGGSGLLSLNKPSPSNLANWEGAICQDAHLKLCPDLIEAETVVRTIDNIKQLQEICKDPQSNACAIRSVRWERADCIIYIQPNANSAILNHENNHCRGWEHVQDSPEAYYEDWVPNHRILRQLSAQSIR